MELWRKTLVDPKFHEMSISDLAAIIKKDLAAFQLGSGVYHNGFDSEWDCIGGVFINPSVQIRAQRVCASRVPRIRIRSYNVTYSRDLLVNYLRVFQKIL